MNVTQCDYCYNSACYTDYQIEEMGVCLPESDNPKYQWGFSVQLSLLIICFQFVWAIGMYTVWLDAQRNSNLVKKGFTLTQMRSAITIALAAHDKTAMSLDDLKAMDPDELEKHLHQDEAAVNYELLARELPFAKVPIFEET